MSRIIKFRCWSEKEKAYLDGPGRFLWVSHDDTTSGLYSPTDLQITLEQYTGLKDKNGKEIYEGDIVNIQGIKYYVDFEHGGFWFNNDNRKWKAYRPLTHFQEINDTEVIGNIHENPELFGGEDETN